ncbi:hypothetical protein INT47_011708, partial [Mucor saturninus]
VGILQCGTRYFYGSTCNALQSVASSAKPKFERTPVKAIVYCKNKADIIAGNREVEEEGEDEVAVEEENAAKNEMMSMVKDLTKDETQFGACVANASEASFTENNRPNFMIGTKVKSKDLYFFFVEVKRPQTTSAYQPEDDYVKLMKQLKDSIHKQLYLGVENPNSLGLLVEGYTCTLFQMMLFADGIYMPMAIDRFSLVEGSHHLVHLPSIDESFRFVKVLIANKKIITTVVNEKKTAGEKRMGRGRLRFSFETKFEAKSEPNTKPKKPKKKTNKTKQ